MLVNEKDDNCTRIPSGLKIWHFLLKIFDPQIIKQEEFFYIMVLY